jgi:hypothetical protein
MNRFKQYVPSFFDVEQSEWIEFSFTEELLELDIVKSFGYSTKKRKFCCFAISDNKLIALYNENKDWLVVGYIEKPELVDFPMWISGRIIHKTLKKLGQLASGSFFELQRRQASEIAKAKTLRRQSEQKSFNASTYSDRCASILIYSGCCATPFL